MIDEDMSPEERERMKEKYHQMGAAVGVGIPKRKPTEEELEQRDLNDSRNQQLAEAMGLEAALKDTHFVRPQQEDDRANIIQMVNFLKAFKIEDGIIKDGDLPQDMLIDFFGFLAPTNSLTNIDNRDYEVGMHDFNIARMAMRMSKPRVNYTPDRNVMEDNVIHLVRAKMLQARGGFERIMSATQRLEEERSVRMQNRPSKIQNAWDKVRGRGE